MNEEKEYEVEYMRSIEWFNKQQLYSIGISFEREDESELFLNIINKNFDLRISEKMKVLMTDSQWDRFQCFGNINEASEWMAINNLDYENMIRQERLEFKRELIKYREEISGLQKNEITNLFERNIDDLEGLKLRDRNRLKRAGLYTVGEVVAYGDLTDIPYLTSFMIERIDAAVNEVLNKTISLKGETGVRNVIDEIILQSGDDQESL